MEDDINKATASVEKHEAISLSTRTYLHKRQTIVKRFSLINTFNKNSSPQRKASTIRNNSMNSMNYLKEIMMKKVEKNTLKTPISIESLDDNFNSTEEIEEINDFSTKSMVSEKKNVMEIENSRVLFSMNSNFFTNIDIKHDDLEDLSSKSPISNEVSTFSPNKNSNSMEIDLIYEVKIEPIDELITPFLRKSLVDKSFIVKKSIQNRNKLPFQSSITQKDPWLQLTGLNSFKNFLALLPKNHEFQGLIEEISNNSRPWKELLFKSMKEYYPLHNIEDFPDFSSLYSRNLSGLQALILMKFFRSDEIERLIANFIHKIFPRIFIAIHKNSIEKILEEKNYDKNCDKPLIVLYNKISFDLKELLEIKAFKLNNRKNIKRITVNSTNINENLFRSMDEAFEEKNWVLIENFEDLKGKELELLIKYIVKTQRNCNNSRFILLYHVSSENYQPISIKNSSLILATFFNNCDKIYLQQEKSINETISSLFLYEREEYKAQQQRKAAFHNNNTKNCAISDKISDKLAPSIKILKSFFNEMLYERAIKLKENTQFFNLHSFLDTKELLNKNSAFFSVIETSKKLRFSLFFLFSIIKMRNKYEKNGENEEKTGEIQVLIEDLFQLLEIFTINPLIFIDKSITFLLKTLNKSYDSTIFSSLFKEYLMNFKEKQLILSIKNHKYELFKNISNMSYEENISKLITNFPNEDHIELFGFHLNIEFQHNFANSQKILTSLRKFDQNYNKSLKKEENLRVFLENSHFYKEFLLNQQKFYTKTEKKANKLSEILVILDKEQSFDLKSNLYHNILEIFSAEILNEKPHFFTFTDDLFIEKPLITPEQIQKWFSDDKKEIRYSNFLSVNPLKKNEKTENNGKINKKSSILFAPIPTEEKKISSVKFKKNSLFLFQNSNSIIKSIIDSTIKTMINPTIKTMINPTINKVGINEENIGKNTEKPPNSAFSKMNSYKNLTDNLVYKTFESTKGAFENSINEETLKSIILNEFLMMNSVKNVMKYDISSLIKNLTGKNGVFLNEKLKNIDNLICSNKTPIEWINHGFIEEDSLYEFCKALIGRLEHLATVLENPLFLQTSIINLTKFFNPFAFIYYLLLDYALEKKVICLIF